MKIRKALPTDVKTVREITQTTISDIYPRYYPKGAVKYFLDHHNDGSILRDIENGQVLICTDDEGRDVGTVTVRGNEISRMFVLPAHQGKGWGSKLLDEAERLAFQDHSEAVLDSSLPAKIMYLKRGYKEAEYHIIDAEGRDHLCYDMMVKKAEKK